MKGWKYAVAVILAVVLLGECLMKVPALVVRATTTRQEIDKTQKEKKEIENKLDKVQDKVDDLKDEKKALQGELNGLNSKLSNISSNLEELEGQIREKTEEINQTQIALDEATAKEEWQYDSMVIRVREMYEQKDTNYMDAIFGEETFADMLNTADMFEKVARYDRMKLDEFKENKEFVQETKNRLDMEKAELDNLLDKAKTEKAKVSELIDQTSGSIAQYAGAIEDAEQKAKEYEDELRKKEEDLEYLKKKLAEETKLSKAAAQGTWRDISQVTFSDGDRKLLANLIYCEAGAEAYEGQLAVGAVVMNRVLSNCYPDTIVGVIYQKKQFTPASSGRLELALASDKATASCYKAADEAMAGVTNVGNCVYFRMPVEGLTGIRIGCHIFY